MYDIKHRALVRDLVLTAHGCGCVHSKLFVCVISILLQSMQGQDILKMLESGRRMSAPRDCPSDLYDIMLSCWNYR